MDGVWTQDIFRNVFRNRDISLSSPRDLVNHSLYFEARTFLHGLLLVEDKLSMAHGLESRVPFLDNDLVDFAMSCPVEFKLNRIDEITRVDENAPGNKVANYFTKTSDGKQILRDAMSAYIPDEISSAVKQGFSAPDGSWFKGESIDFVRRKLLEGDPMLNTIFDGDVVRSLVQEHLDGTRNRRLLVWSFLNIEEWLNQNFG